MTRLLAALALAVALPVLAVSAGAGAALAAEKFTIGYLQLKKDPRYLESRAFARYLAEPLGRPYPGARVAMDEIKFHGVQAGVEFRLKRKKRKNAASLAKAVRKMAEKDGARFFVADLPGDALGELAAATAGMDILLLNVSARDDRLRGEGCHAHLLHIVPSHRMAMDALSQFLSFKRWREALVLEGPTEADKALADAFRASAAKFRLDIVETRAFTPSNDPRERDRNNVVLLTGGVDYDVIFVADSDGEFARDVPYHSVLPRPVVGSAGLTGAAWHWSWERHGAPQLENRFRREAGRQMRDFDWSAWMAVKAVAKAVQGTASADFATLRDFLLGDEIEIDTVKGNPSRFRPWNNQLRQPMLISRQNWVVNRAPMKGFEHRLDDLDTLGIDEAESRCRFD